MKNTYPITLIPDEFGYLVFIPDFNINCSTFKNKKLSFLGPSFIIISSFENWI